MNNEQQHEATTIVELTDSELDVVAGGRSIEDFARELEELEDRF